MRSRHAISQNRSGQGILARVGLRRRSFARGFVACAALLVLGACSSSASKGAGGRESTVPSPSPPTTRGLSVSPNLLSPDPNGFAGYVLRGHTTEIYAEWVVPTIAAGSPVGQASTWVGAENKANDFVQVGTLENEVSRAGQAGAVYRAFWSDTALYFHPHDLGAVRPGDAVSAEMMQLPDGWFLIFHDTTHPFTRTVSSNYGARKTFTDAQWLQEDPTSHGFDPVTNYPYPTMSTVTFSNLMVNNGHPVLPYSDGRALISPNGVFLVPTPVTDDGFTVRSATGPQAQYLAAVGPLNSAVNEVYSDLTAGPRTAVASDTAALMTAIDATEARLASGTWPPAAAGPIASLIQEHKRLIVGLRTWIASSSPSLRTFEAIFPDNKPALQVRRVLGLPTG